MLRNVLAALALAGPLAGCSDDPKPVEYAEHCGATGPVRILELEPGQAHAGSRTIGDHDYHLIGRFDPSGSFGPTIVDRSVWASRACGQSPAQLVQGDRVLWPYTVAPWPELPLICLEDSGVVALDPTGLEPPRLVFPLPGCHIAAWTDHGLLGFTNVAEDSPFADLQLTPYPDDPKKLAPAPILLATQVQQGTTRVLADGVHVLTDDATLMRIDLVDHETTTIQTNVAGYEISDDGAYLVWQDASAPVFSLRDNSTGTSVALGTTDWLFLDVDLSRIADGVLALGDRLFFLPELTVVALPRNYRLLHLDSDRSFAVVYPPFGGRPGLRRVDLRDGTVTTLFSRDAQVIAREDDALLVLDIPPCCINSLPNTEGEVWRVPFDGAPAYRVADRATRLRKSPDPHTIVTLVDIASDGLATLLHIDIDTRSEQVIDDHVVHLTGDSADLSIITYTVDDGPRSGVYTARLATTP